MASKKTQKRKHKKKIYTKKKKEIHIKEEKEIKKKKRWESFRTTNMRTNHPLFSTTI